MRRANDVSQDSGFAPAPSAGKHDDPEFGTHHARDAAALLSTIGWEPADLLLGDEAEHPVHALALVRHGAFQAHDQGEVVARLRANRRIALTERRSSNQIFSFGRDHGYYGRILSQAVISAPTLAVKGEQRDHRLLLHAAGRQLARLVDRRGALADGSRCQAAAPSGCRCWTGSSSARSRELRPGVTYPGSRVRSPALLPCAHGLGHLSAVRLHADPVRAVPEVPQERLERVAAGAPAVRAAPAPHARRVPASLLRSLRRFPAPADARRRPVLLVVGRRACGPIGLRPRPTERRRADGGATPEPWTLDLTGRWQAKIPTTIAGPPPRPALREVFVETDRSGNHRRRRRRPDRPRARGRRARVTSPFPTGGAACARSPRPSPPPRGAPRCTLDFIPSAALGAPPRATLAGRGGTAAQVRGDDVPAARVAGPDYLDPGRRQRERLPLLPVPLARVRVGPRRRTPSRTRHPPRAGQLAARLPRHRLGPVRGRRLRRPPGRRHDRPARRPDRTASS